MIFVSSCLVGENCKYSGGNNKNEMVMDFLKGKEYLMVCPEQLGNLPCPRPSAEIQNGRVMNQDGEDVTEAFILGAEKVLKMAQTYLPTLCILKENSPSCGVHLIYDGTFSKRKIKGMGFTANRLIESGFSVISEEDISIKSLTNNL